MNKDYSYIESEQIINSSDNLPYFYEMNFEISAKMLGEYAADILCSVRDTNHMLADLVSKGPLLIYRYSELNCNTCYESELKNLQKCFLGNEERVIILCSYTIEKHFNVFKKVNKISLPIYRIAQDSFDWIAEQYGSPYYFILHPSMKVSDFYFPAKEYPHLNLLYLEGVKRYLSH